MDEQKLTETLKGELEQVAETLFDHNLKAHDRLEETLREKLEELGGLLSQIPAGDEARATEQAVGSLDLRVKKLQALIEKLPKQVANGIAKRMESQLEALKRAAAQAGQGSKPKAPKKKLSVGALIVAGLTLFLGGALGGIALHKWVVKSDPQVQLDQATRSQMILGLLLVEQMSKMDEKRQKIVMTWLRGSGDLPLSGGAGPRLPKELTAKDPPKSKKASKPKNR
jgi:hypothetical protein